MGNGALDLWRDPCDTVRIETDLGRQFQLARNRSGLGSPGPDTGSFRLFGGQLDMIAAIGTTSDLKASVDLNSRILAEVAVLLSESIRVQAAAAGSAGTEAAASARDRAAQRRFLQGVGREE